MPTVRHYIALGIIIFIAVVVANLPAKLLFEAVESKLPANTPLKLGEVEGTVWKGQLGLDYAGVNLSANWDILLLQILRGRLAADITVFDQGHEPGGSNASRVEGTVFGSLLSSAGFYAVNGVVSATLVNRLAQNQFSMEQNIALEALGITYQNQQFKVAEGKLTWPGGRVGYEDPNRGQQQLVLPALKGTLAAEDGHLLASLIPQGTEDVLVDANIDGEGIATLAVRKRLLDLVGQRWGTAVNPDDVVLEIQQPVF